MKRIISILLAVVVVFTSIDVTALASEEEGSEEQISDDIDEVVSESVSADMANEWETSQGQSASETENEEIIIEDDSEDVNETKTQEQMLETDTTDLTETDIEIVEVEEDVSETESLETEQDEDEIAVESSNDLNEAVRNKILSFKNKYGEGYLFNYKYDNAEQCFGFAKLIADEVFGSHPADIRKSSDGTVSNGWKCYYVTEDNLNTLLVEPGDIIDVPEPHTAMVLSVSSDKTIKCVQCNWSKNQIPDNKVYWDKYFNYNSNKSTLYKIWEAYSGKNIRLWKPSDTLKMKATGYNPGPSTLGIKGESAPTTVIQGSNWTCKGTISSNYALEHIGGYILSSDGKTIVYSKSVENPGIMNYSLEGSEIAKALTFDKLPTGTYWYQITAHDASGKREYLIKKQFTVIAKDTPSTLGISGATYPASINYGTDWGCKGTITSNYALQHIGGYILGSDGKTEIYSKSVDNLETTSYSLEGSTIAQELKFNKLEAGTYWYQITAHDISGNRLYLIKTEFTVVAQNSSLGISGENYPVSLIQGTKWTCRGTIRSDYILEHIGSYILGSDGKTVLYSKTIEQKDINSTSYSLENSDIAEALAFDKLPVGTYWYQITAHDTSGTRIYLIKSEFTVVAKNTPSTLHISEATSPTSIDQGMDWICKGMITSNYTLEHIGGYILDSDGQTIIYSKTIENLNTVSYSLEGSEIDKALRFDRLPEGTYWYQITAHDASGQRSYLVKVQFDVTVQCSFSGELLSPVDGQGGTVSYITVRANAFDHHGIESFDIELSGEEYENNVNVVPDETQAGYECSYDMDLPVEGVYIVTVNAVCGDGQIHRVGQSTIIFDTTVPVVTQIKVENWELADGKDEFVYSALIDGDVENLNIWAIVNDERGNEKRFEPDMVDNSINGGECLGYWSDISGLDLNGKYTLTIYAQNRTGSIGYSSKEIVISELSSNPEKVNLIVGESAEVNIALETFFKVREKCFSESDEFLEITDNGLNATVKGLKPGNRRFSFQWCGKNEAVSINPSCDIYAYIIPKAPTIIRVSNDNKGYDTIIFEPVEYAKSYELYRMRIGIDDEYQLLEEFADNKNHSLMVEHTDENIVTSYKLCAKAAETIDVYTNERYYPTSNFSNEMTGKAQQEEGSETESSETEESSSMEESSDEKSDSTDGSIKEGLYIIGLRDKIYTGSAIKQEIQLFYNKVSLTEGTDYTLTYKNNIKTGTASVIIKAKGNLTGSVIKNFEIKPREITDKDVIIEDAVYTFDNKMHKKAPKVFYQGKALKEGKDFIVSDYGKGDYIAAGTYTIQIEGIGNFKGNFDNAKLIIADQYKNISKASLTKISVQQYNGGKAVELPDHLIKVTLFKTELKKDIDYTVGYANNTKPGKATLIIKGIGAYAGTKKFTFNIKQTPVSITENMVENKNSIAMMEMVKGGVMPEPVLISNGYTLKKGVDYVLSFKNNKKTGSNASIVIKGKGNFKGSITLPFTITTKSISSTDLTVRVPDVPYTGKANKYQSKPVIIDKDGNILTLNKDYTIQNYRINDVILDKHSNPENNADIIITIQGKGNYTGTTTEEYKLRGAKFSSARLKINTKSYTGKAITIESKDIISASIKMGKTKKSLVYGKDYEIVSYENNIRKGTATVIFRGKGDYAGEKAVKFKIRSSYIAS